MINVETRAVSDFDNFNHIRRSLMATFWYCSVMFILGPCYHRLSVNPEITSQFIHWVSQYCWTDRHRRWSRV